MFARVSTFRADDAAKLVEGFEELREPLEHIDGFSHATFLVDRTSGKAMSITFWRTQEAMAASAAQADELRRRGAETGRGSIESVENYEVGLTVGSESSAMH